MKKLEKLLTSKIYGGTGEPGGETGKNVCTVKVLPNGDIRYDSRKDVDWITNT